MYVRAEPTRSPMRCGWAAAVSDFFERAPALLVAGFGALFHLLLYGLANRFPSGPATALAETWLDRAVPFWPWTSFIYASSHALVFAGFALSRAPGARTRYVAVFAATIACSALIHWAVPVRFPREAFPLEGRGAGEVLLQWLRTLDRPTSALPSLHVAMAVMAALQGARERPRAAPALWLWALAISASTLTTKQHYAVDVVAGAALALAADLLAGVIWARVRRRAPALSLEARLAAGPRRPWGRG